MDASALFPSAYFRALDFSQPRQLTIAGLTLETMPDGARKPALSFSGEGQKLVLNKTNTQMLAAVLGNETNAWTGRTIECFADKASMQGRIVDCIRVRVPQQVSLTQQTDWNR